MGCFKKMDTEYYLKNIYNTEKIMLDVLTSIDSKLTKYLGTEKDGNIEKITKLVKEAKFTSSQWEQVKEIMTLCKETGYLISHKEEVIKLNE